MFKRLCGILILVVLLNSIVNAAPPPEPPFHLTDVQPLNEIGATQFMVISPDGSTLALWAEDELCLYTFADEATNCTLVSDDVPQYVNLTWSPDSRYLAFHEDPFRMARESDMWIFDVLAGEFANLTDDEVYGGIFSSERDAAVPLDYVPLWHPVTGDLYFFRSMFHTPDDYTFELYRMTIDGEPEQAFDLTASFPEPFNLYNTDIFSLQGAAAFSPDGTLLAMLIRPHEWENSALWILDMISGELQKIADWAAFTSGMPVWMEESLPGFTLDGVAWSGDGTGLVVTAVNFQYANPIFANTYAVDLATNTVSPMIDFSTIPDEAALYQDEDSDGFLPVYDVPYASLISPDGTWLLYINRQDNQEVALGVSALPLSAEITPPIRLAAIPAVEFEPRPMYQATAGFDGAVLRVVMGGYLFTFE